MDGAWFLHGPDPAGEPDLAAQTGEGGSPAPNLAVQGGEGL